MKLRALTASLFIAGLLVSSGSAMANKEIYLPVVSKGFMHEFWQTVKMGSDAAAEELKVKTSFVGPSDETQIDQQIQLIENTLAKKPNGLLLAALDGNALIPSVNRMHAKNVSIVTFDSGVNSDIPSAFVATNNNKAGAMAAAEVGRLLNGKGKVGIVAHVAGTTSAIDRVDGFVEHMKANYPNIVLLDPLYSDGDPQKAMNQTMDITRANPDLAAVYGTNEGSSMGVATAIQSMGKKDKIKVVGFDSSEAIVNFVETGVMQAAVVQDAYSIGYIGLKTLHKVMKGETVEKLVDVPAVLVTGDNIRDARIQKVINPLG
ncbi:ABC transporter substrate-binding protein [Endozoicomonas sp. ONNA2]|uniref:ABC transporter substrate-binding protein n=1 Tax=Endozoicomonas sp. ONNA2 TaxID=2828741 RepID=UPI002148127A|nr:ABC transporter substrate-binding protein [Endozoicomonas sp. ONNA2]